MTLPETFECVRPSIVAFISRLARGKVGSQPLFPPVLGTGFLVDSRGIALTNRHVVDALAQIPKNPKTQRIAAAAFVFLPYRAEGGSTFMRAAVPDVLRWWSPKEFQPGLEWYGEDTPDLAFVQLNVTGTPSLPIADGPRILRAGLSVATAGFSLGQTPMTMFNKLTQVVPLLRRGIVSSVFPFAGAFPHGFTLDVMIQGGASGSPVFLEGEPTVVGMLGASLLDDGANTNISVGLPGHLLASALKTFINSVSIETDGVPTLKSMFPPGSGKGPPMNWSEYEIPSGPK
jgi:S1-C subfamily serine protease